MNALDLLGCNVITTPDAHIPCRVGGYPGRQAHIYEHSDSMLGFSGADVVLRRQLLRLGCVSHQRGDIEFSVLFAPSLFPTVARIVKPEL
jgi:hypothetical protein